jgi:hypothetical protein
MLVERGMKSDTVIGWRRNGILGERREDITPFKMLLSLSLFLLVCSGPLSRSSSLCPYHFSPISTNFYTLKMETELYSEMPVNIYLTTRRHIPQDSNLHLQPSRFHDNNDRKIKSTHNKCFYMLYEEMSATRVCTILCLKYLWRYVIIR